MSVASGVLGGFSYAIGKTLSAPCSRCKIILQSEHDLLRNGKISTPFRGIGDVIRTLISGGGLISLWRGNMTMLIRFFPSQYFHEYVGGFIKRKILNKKKTDKYCVKFVKDITMYCSTGMAYLIFAQPLDYAYAKLTSDLPVMGVYAYTGVLDVWKKTVASQGIKGLYVGFAASCIYLCVYRISFYSLREICKYGLGDSVDQMKVGYELYLK
jgi:solute carrier family 25 (mitochondrial adenine nucleotide translocator), member 4/5/6/31